MADGVCKELRVMGMVAQEPTDPESIPKWRDTFPGLIK